MATKSAENDVIMRAKLSSRAKFNVPDLSSATIENVEDEKSGKEAQALAVDKLDQQAKAREHGRTEKFRDAVALAVLIVFWLAFAGIVTLGLIWFWHLITPPGSLRFLDTNQIDRIGTLLLGGITTSFVSGYAKKRIG